MFIPWRLRSPGRNLGDDAVFYSRRFAPRFVLVDCFSRFISTGGRRATRSPSHRGDQHMAQDTDKRWKVIERPQHDELGEGLWWSSRQNAVYWVDILSHALYRHSLAGGPVQRWQLP